MSTFLDDLKNSVDKGEFNSEAAKKIIDINNLADEKLKALTKTGQSIEDSDLAKAVEDRVKDNAKVVSEEEALELNSQYEKQMEQIKKQDAINQQLATLIEIEDMVRASVKDMLSFVEQLEEKFSKFLGEKDPMVKDLAEGIAKVKNVYEPTLIEYVHKEASKE